MVTTGIEFALPVLNPMAKVSPVFLPRQESQGREAWWAAICGVAQSQTRLKLLSSSSSKLN